ncbi:hypothetical protein OROGR_017815 [Orobanche gracilis]
MGTSNKGSGMSRRERRREARLAKNKKKFDYWVQQHVTLLIFGPFLLVLLFSCCLISLLYYEARTYPQSKKSSPNLNSKYSSEAVQENASKYATSQPKLSNLRSIDSTKQSRTFGNSRTKKGSKEKIVSGRTPKTNFFKLLEMETVKQVSSADEDLMLEKRFAKKLKLKNGKMSSANNDLGVFLEGIPSALDSLASKNSNKSNLVNEGLEDEISDDGGDEELDSLASGEEHDDDVGDEEFDSLASSEKHDDDVGDEEFDSLASSKEYDDDVGDEEFDSLASSEEHDEMVGVISLKNSTKWKRKKRDFEEYLENDIHGGQCLGEADLALERKLAKKLKVKAGRVQGEDDDINMLLEGIPSTFDSLEEERVNNPTDYLKKNIGKYIAPHLRSHGGNESSEYAQLRKKVRGLLNRLSETNVESITGEISNLFPSVGRTVGSQIVCEEVVASCSGGPRGNEQYAAIFAAFVAGMTCLVGMEFGAKLLARVAKCFEDEYLKEDNLSLRNLTLLFSYLYVFGICSRSLGCLMCCGMKLRGDDPAGMKNFILSVQSRVTELKTSSENGQSHISSKRMEFMLETICDIKNNKKRSKEDTVQHSRIKKWLQKSRADDVLIRGLTWSRLLDPSKKGQWWLSGDIAPATENIEEVAGTIDKEISETKKMLQLAASQRMNTDIRRAIFCIIMSAEDYIDALEKLLRLDLPGKQDREIMRVLVECCLQEKVFNKYYCVLASKLCSHDINHKFTLQYCLWDHFKELDSMPLIRSMNLSKFTAEMVASFSLSLAVLKAVELNDSVHLSPNKVMHFKMLFENIFEFPDKYIWNIFTRLSVNPEYEHLRSGIEFFISNYIVSGQQSLANKFKLAKKALNNVKGILM